MNNIEILEEFIEQYNASYPEEKEWVAIYPEQIQAIENLIQENKELRIQISARETVVDKLTKENKKLKEQMGKDLDVVYIKGVYDERDKWKNKIKEKIEELEKDLKDFEEYWSKDPRRFKRQQSIDYYKLETLKELLKEGE